MSEEEIRAKFDEAIANGDLKGALQLIHQAEEMDYDSTAMRDIWAKHDVDWHND